MIRGLSVLALLRTLAVVLAALLAVTLGAHRVAVLPDLVLPIVVAGGLLAGPSRGAMLGLAAGWVVDLMPPGSAVLGTSALLYAVAGLVAGAGRREGETPMAWVALVAIAASGVLAAGRLASALLSSGPVHAADLVLRFGTSAVLAIVAVPLLVRAEHALVRRNLA